MEEMKVHMEEEKQNHHQEIERLLNQQREEALSLTTQNQQLQVWQRSTLELAVIK